MIQHPKLKQILYQSTNSLTLWLLFLAVCGFFYVFNSTQLPFSIPNLSKYLEGLSPLETKVFYSPDYLFKLLETLGQKGRNAYTNLLLLDLIFPLVYTAFFSLTNLTLHQRETFITKLGKIAFILPLLGGLFDYAENFSLLILRKNFPNQFNLLAILSSLSTPLKTIAFLTNSILLILGLIQLIFLKNAINKA